MKVIIFAYAKENHTAPVKWALEQAGYEVACWGGLSWTAQQQSSLLFDAQTKQTKMTLGPYTVEPGDAIWIRRPDVPTHNPNVCNFALPATQISLDYPRSVLNEYSSQSQTRNPAVSLFLPFWPTQDNSTGLTTYRAPILSYGNNRVAGNATDGSFTGLISLQ